MRLRKISDVLFATNTLTRCKFKAELWNKIPVKTQSEINHVEKLTLEKFTKHILL